MKLKKINVKTFCTLLVIIGLSINSSAQVKKDSDLYKKVVSLDKELFDAYNNCKNAENLKKHGAFYADDIEFFHDGGGLQTSKKDLVASIGKNICGKVKRELVAGSLEVHKIPNYGVVVIGHHKFHNLVEKSISQPSKFILFWREKSEDWELAKVVSLH